MSPDRDFEQLNKDDSPKIDLGEEIRRDFLKQKYLIWSQIVGKMGYEVPEEDSESVDRERYFLFDCNDEPSSLFTSVRLHIQEINCPVEEFSYSPETFKSEDGERWIVLDLFPNSIDSPKFKFDGGYCDTESIYLFISNHGRGFEHLEWWKIALPGDVNIQGEKMRETVYLKELPTQYELTPPPSSFGSPNILETFQPITEGALGKLDFVKEKILNGEFED